MNEFIAIAKDDIGAIAEDLIAKANKRPETLISPDFLKVYSEAVRDYQDRLWQLYRRTARQGQSSAS